MEISSEPDRKEEDTSELGEYLEDYGFEMEETDTEQFYLPEIPEDTGTVRNAMKNIKTLGKVPLDQRKEVEKILEEMGIKTSVKDLGEQFTCIYREPAQGTGVVLAAKHAGYRQGYEKSTG